MVTTSICQYRNHVGEILALAKGFVHHSPSDEASKSQGKYEEFAKPYKYTDEEIAKIEADKRKRKCAGVNRVSGRRQRSESIGHIVVGPWTIMSFFAWVSAAGVKGIRFPIGGDGGIYDPASMRAPHWAACRLRLAELSASRAITTSASSVNVWLLSCSPTGWEMTASSGSIPSNSADLWSTAIHAVPR